MTPAIETYLARLRFALRARGVAAADAVDELYDHLMTVADAALTRGDDPHLAVDAAIARLGHPSTLAARLATASEGFVQRFAPLHAALIGLAILWIDTRPHWDDSGVTAGLLFLGAAEVVVFSPRRPWLTALLVGGWLAGHGVVTRQDPKMLLVLLFPFAGAFAAAGARRIFARA